MWWFFFRTFLEVVGACVACGAVSVIAYLVVCCLFDDDSLRERDTEAEPNPIRDVHRGEEVHDDTPLNYLSLDQLLAKAADARTQLARVERAVCVKMQATRESDEMLCDEIVAAVHDGHGTQELLAKYNRRTFGTRWCGGNYMPFTV